jgi:hypothetical protein
MDGASGPLMEVRFYAESGSSRLQAALRKSAMCGRLRVGKENLHVAGLVGAAMCSDQQQISRAVRPEQCVIDGTRSRVSRLVVVDLNLRFLL